MRALGGGAGEEVLAIYAEVDVDANHALSRDEFLHFCQQLFSDDAKPHAVSLLRAAREIGIHCVVLSPPLTV